MSDHDHNHEQNGTLKNLEELESRIIEQTNINNERENQLLSAIVSREWEIDHNFPADDPADDPSNFSAIFNIRDRLKINGKYEVGNQYIKVNNFMQCERRHGSRKLHPIIQKDERAGPPNGKYFIDKKTSSVTIPAILWYANPGQVIHPHNFIMEFKICSIQGSFYYRLEYGVSHFTDGIGLLTHHDSGGGLPV